MLNRRSFIALLAIVAVLGWCGMSYADSALMQYSGNGHLYQRIDINPYPDGLNYDPAVGDWHTARDACAAQGGYLATVTSAEEDQFIYNNLVYWHGIFSWLGATDEVTEGTFIWVTGEPWGYTHWDTLGGEPNDGWVCNPGWPAECFILGQDYLAMYPYNGKWYDIGPPMDTYRMAFQTADSYVCEFDQGVCQGPNVPGVAGMTQAAAGTAIAAAGLVVGAVTQQKSTTTAIGIVISTMPAAGTTICAGSMAVDLVVSSGVSVPNVAGMTQAQATTSITSAGLVLGTVTLGTSATLPAGTVMGQSPYAGTHVNGGTTVDLVIVEGCCAQSVPNVEYMNQASATTVITNAGLVVGNVTQQTSRIVPVGFVISQHPPAGTLVIPGSAVDLVISTGTPVPNVVGMTQAAATNAITEAGFIVGSWTTKASAAVPKGSVVSQSPAAGANVASGSAVNLVVSSGPGMVTVPNVVGRTQGAATTALTTAGLTVGTVTAQLSATTPAGSVISQNPVKGTTVAAGSAVNLVVSSGPPPHVGIQTDRTSYRLKEGWTGQIQVKLDQAPPSNVTVSASIVGNDPDIYIVGGQTLAFTSSNWATYQPVLIAALPDQDMLNDSATLRLTSDWAAPDWIAPVEVPLLEFGGGSCAPLVALPDVNGNGSPDLAVLQFNANTSAFSIVISDGRTRKTIRTISINANWRPVSVAVLTGGGACTIAVLEREETVGSSVRCEMIDAFTGKRGTQVNFDPYSLPLALAVLPDMNGNGSMELAVLSLSGVQVKDSQTRKQISRVAFGYNLLRYAFGALPDMNGNGSPELALLGGNLNGTTFTVWIRDAHTGNLVQTIPLRTDYTPAAMTVIPDLNGSSGQEIAVLGFAKSGGQAAVQVKDALTGDRIGFAPFGLIRTSSFLAIPDLTGNGLPELCVLGTGTKGGFRIEIREALTGALIRTIGLAGTAAPRGLALLPDLNGAGNSALAVLRLDKSTGASVIEIIDSKTGLSIPPLK